MDSPSHTYMKWPLEADDSNKKSLVPSTYIEVRKCRHHVKAFKKKIDSIGYNIYYKNSANCKKLAASMHRRHVVKRTKLMNWYHKNKMIL